MKLAFPEMGRYSIRTKLLTINFVTIGTVLFLLTIILQGIGFVSGRAVMVEDMRTQVSMIASNSTAALVFNDPRAANEILSALRASPMVRRAALFTLDRQVFASYQRDTAEAGPMIFSTENENGHAFALSYLDIFQNVFMDNQRVGTLYLRADMKPLYLRLLWNGVIVSVLALMALAVGFVVLNRLQRTISAPIIHLADLARQVSEKRDYSIRSPVESADEIGELAKSFNEMLKQIQTRDAELAHELMERKKAEQRLDHLANYDTVTGLPNRYYFNDRLSMALSRSNQSHELVALMFLDLDNFKIVNDTLGHHVGDELLHYVAHRLQAVLRPGDAICRVGGDEFAIILENLTDASQAEMVAHKCMKSLSGAMDFSGHGVYISVSIGISLYPQDTTDMHELLKNADTAMYHAKAKGKNTCQVFLSEMKGMAQKRLTLETNLRRAIERNEFHLHYQPLIQFPGREIVGVEALIRWMHPELGVVNPADFIPLAEETGLIIPIGAWVLQTACEQAKAWNDMSLEPIIMAVNLSGRQFKEKNIVAEILSVLKKTGLDPRLLELELTESILMENDSSTIAKMRELDRAGIRLSVDDFGTGYSSMTTLKNFPISILKVDRSFVRDLPDDGDDAAITEAIIAMAKSLKLSVTAEGVETEEQALYLEEKSCNRCQGFYFSRPAPALEITAKLQKSNAIKIQKNKIPLYQRLLWDGSHRKRRPNP